MEKANQNNLSVKEDVILVAWGILKRKSFNISKCPFCGKKHKHVGDEKYGPYQGIRLNHCDKKENFSHKQYALIAENLIPDALK